jgi:hypothetical protein
VLQALASQYTLHINARGVTLVAQTVKDHLRGALALMFKPLVRLLISQGLTHAEFSEVAKEVYVEVALRHFEPSPRINKSRVAVLTGLTRKEVKNVVDRAIESSALEKNKSRPSRVLSGWYEDPRFTGPYGIPLELPYESPKQEQASFTELVRTYSGDMAPRQMLNELLRSGSVIEVDGLYKAASRLYEPTALSPELIQRLGDIGYRFFSTAALNITKEGQGTGYFERSVFANEGCTPSVIEKFDEHIKSKGQGFLEELDIWFSANEHLNERSDQRHGTGLFMVHYVEDQNEKTSLRMLLQKKDVT